MDHHENKYPNIPLFSLRVCSDLFFIIGYEKNG